MRRVLVLCTLLAGVLAAGPIRWQGSFDAARQRAEEERKPLLVLLVKRECDACRKAVAAMNGDGPLARLVNGRTIPVLVTKENEDYPIELLYTLEFPTLFLLSPEETFLAEPVRGEIDASGLRRLLEEELPDER